MIGLVVLFTGCQNKQTENDSNNDKETGDNVNEEEGSAHHSSKQMVGSWAGSIEIPNEPLPIQVTFENEQDIDGHISIPVQGLSDYPFSLIQVNDDGATFSMDIQGQKATFKGDITEDEIAGTFTQHGQSFPFTLKRDNTGSEEDGEFLEIETDMGTLVGELHMPESMDEAPVMLIIPGSGNTDRNGNSSAGKNNSLKYLAEELGDQGIASLRFDKRGAGKNSEAIGDEADFHFDQYVTDAVQWVELLRSDERFTSVGIIGHSEGSLVGIMAAQDIDIDAFISLAGAGRPIDVTLYEQLEASGMSERLLSESASIIDQLKEGEEVLDVSDALYNLFRPSVQPYMISWMAHDPAKEIAELDIPILIINGTHDIQVPVLEAETLAEAKPEADLSIIEEMNHVLKEAPKDRTKNMATYSDPSLPLADNLMKDIMDFLEGTSFLDQE